MVTKVNLLDPDVEPTDEELEALMRDFQRVVLERREKTRAAFASRLAEQIRAAMREDSAIDPPRASSNPGHAY